jgi:hypothetical protein
MLTKEEFLALAAQQYEQLQQLDTQMSFRQYEQGFVKLWQDFGRQTLEQSLTPQATPDYKKKDDDLAGNDKNTQATRL